MFERYTDECKRAIYFAQQIALSEGAAAINSIHLLLGLLMEVKYRANNIFRLREQLQAESTQVVAFEMLKVVKGTIPLSTDGKRVVAYAGREANRLRDYWIDTEHIVLGILREGDNAAAGRLRAIGLDLETSRQWVVENKGSRPARLNPVLWWVRRRPLGIILSIVFLLGIILGLYLLGFGGAK